jgi:acyl-CoA thioester hydrolase
MPEPFTYRFRVRFAECDAQQVVFNAHYATYVDMAVFEFMRAIGFAESHLKKGPLDYQVVRQILEWKGSARFDDVVEAAVRANHLGTTSFTIATDFRLHENRQPIVSVETVYVLVEAAGLRKLAIPSDLRGALERGAASLSVDHANCTPRKCD